MAVGRHKMQHASPAQHPPANAALSCESCCRHSANSAARGRNRGGGPGSGAAGATPVAGVAAAAATAQAGFSPPRTSSQPPSALRCASTRRRDMAAAPGVRAPAGVERKRGGRVRSGRPRRQQAAAAGGDARQQPALLPAMQVQAALPTRAACMVAGRAARPRRTLERRLEGSPAQPASAAAGGPRCDRNRGQNGQASQKRWHTRCTAAAARVAAASNSQLPPPAGIPTALVLACQVPAAAETPSQPSPSRFERPAAPFSRPQPQPQPPCSRPRRGSRAAVPARWRPRARRVSRHCRRPPAASRRQLPQAGPRPLAAGPICPAPHSLPTFPYPQPRWRRWPTRRRPLRAPRGGARRRRPPPPPRLRAAWRQWCCLMSPTSMWVAN